MTYAGVPFQNSIEGGGNIIIPFLQSPNFVPGVSGWRISRNGDAEFASQTLRGPLIVIDPLTGLVVASIGQTGTIAGQFATIENDLLIAGQSVGDLFLNGRGLVGFFGTTSGSIPAPANSGGWSDTAWFSCPLQGDRIYLIACTPLRANRLNSNLTGRTLTMRIHAFDDQGNPAFNTAVNPVQMFGGGSTHVITSLIFAVDTNPLTRVSMTFQFQLSQDETDDWAMDATGGWNMYCLDMGNFSQALAVLSGGVGTSGGAIAHQKIYQATDSQSYNSSSNPFDNDEQLWRGDFGDGKGNTRSICIFPGATIRSDLATASTITSATLSIYCLTATESNGSLGFEGATNTTPPATLGAGSVEYAFDDDWPVPGWNTINILNDFLDDILAGDNAMHLCTVLFGISGTRFMGFANPTFRPYITVNYTE